jgi:catechol 2,3-dioxygenase-like lactoylglutathione lyase family enzyme
MSHPLLSDAELVAFIPTRDLEAAKEFYGRTLGLDVVEENDFAIVFDANGTQLRVTRVEQLRPDPFTVLGWRVADIAERIAALRSAGVSATRYDEMEQDDDGVWIAPSGTRVAWFADPDGNTLSLQREPANDPPL